jgi:two-component system sensor histidine kinase UhpB
MTSSITYAQCGQPSHAANAPGVLAPVAGFALSPGYSDTNELEVPGHADISHSRRVVHRREDDNDIQAGAGKNERNRIAQQIHDDLGGVLTGLKACISVSIDRASRTGMEADPLLVEAAALADMAFQAARRIASDLRPVVLEQMGVWEALEWQVAALTARTNIGVDYFADARLTLAPFGDERGLLVFRIVCEALCNVEKHAQASKASLRLFETDSSLVVTVSDNGVGMDPNLLHGGATRGISGMKERAREAGGEVTVCSERGMGTTVRLAVPIERSDGS